MSDDAKGRLDGEALAGVERRIVEALPEIVEGLIGRAKEGDVRAAAYLIDRILGKTAAMKTPPAERSEAGQSGVKALRIILHDQREDLNRDSDAPFARSSSGARAEG